MNRIRLVPTIRERSKYQRERRYLDFEVDGVSLRSLVDTGLDLISVLVTDRPRDPLRLARVLGEAPGDAPDGCCFTSAPNARTSSAVPSPRRS